MRINFLDNRYTRNFLIRFGNKFIRRFIVILIISIIAIFKPARQSSQNSIDDARTYKVASIYDGDTIVVKDNNNSIHVRLIGIDAPELHKNKKARIDSQRSGLSLKKIFDLGTNSYQHLKQLVPVGTEIKLKSDVAKLDRFGRSLSYIYLMDGTFINKLMIEDGYAYLHIVRPNVQFENVLAKAANRARKNRAGLWAQVDLDRL